MYNMPYMYVFTFSNCYLGMRTINYPILQRQLKDCKRNINIKKQQHKTARFNFLCVRQIFEKWAK